MPGLIPALKERLKRTRIKFAEKIDQSVRYVVLRKERFMVLAGIIACFIILGYGFANNLIPGPWQKIPVATLSLAVTGCQNKTYTEEVGLTKAGVDYVDKLDIGSVKGNIIVNQGIKYYCCAEIRMRWTREKNVISVNEYNAGEVCKCVCYYSVQGALGPFDGGNYKVVFNGLNGVVEKNVEVVDWR
jgi:hypothetical protein